MKSTAILQKTSMNLSLHGFNPIMSTNGTYVAHLMVKEGNSNLIELSLDVPLEEQAKEMCSKWKDSSQDIYEFIMQSLM